MKSRTPTGSDRNRLFHEYVLACFYSRIEVDGAEHGRLVEYYKIRIRFNDAFIGVE